MHGVWFCGSAKKGIKQTSVVSIGVFRLTALLTRTHTFMQFCVVVANSLIPRILDTICILTSA